MIIGICLGLVLLATIILYVTDDDRDAVPLFMMLVCTLVIISIVVGYESHTHYEAKQEAKLSIKVITENGKSDTTYIYKFEEEK
jgi:hypothetical protein